MIFLDDFLPSAAASARFDVASAACCLSCSSRSVARLVVMLMRSASVFLAGMDAVSHLNCMMNSSAVIPFTFGDGGSAAAALYAYDAVDDASVPWLGFAALLSSACALLSLASTPEQSATALAEASAAPSSASSEPALRGGVSSCANLGVGAE